MMSSENHYRPMKGAADRRANVGKAELELSVVIPCLNEADTIGVCVEKATRGLRDAGIRGEVVVADNGSSDGSQQIATQRGARIVNVAERGYGAALMGGIESSCGRFIVMGDADDSYDFLEIPKFVEALRAGADLAQGCRLPSGGGRVLPGAMPPLHRWIGNPLLSWLVRRMFRIPIRDVYCGMRGFTRRLYDQLDLRSPGMEFATEMVIKSGLYDVRIAQVPITLHPDGRQSHGPHLRTFRDGWRTLRLFLIFSPRWTFCYPGLILIAMGLLGYALALPGIEILGATLDVHTLLIASLVILLGWQSLLMAALARIFAAHEAMMPPAPRLERWTVERGIVLAIALGLAGVALIGTVTLRWWWTDFGDLAYPITMRLVIPGIMLVAIAFQALSASLFAGVLRMHRSHLAPK